MKKVASTLPLTKIKVQDSFWSRVQKLVREVVIPYQEDILEDRVPGIEKSHAIENFRIAAGESKEEFYGMVFQDSDLAKWLEAAAYSLANVKDDALETRVDTIIDLLGRAQLEDGYLNTYFTIKEPEHRWENLQECHELYCAGHMIEAAVAYYESTGKDKFLKIMSKMADHIDARFGEGRTPGIPGHEEIELALLRLYRATGEERYLKLSEHFINERGMEPDYFKQEVQNRNWVHYNMNADNRKYAQNHAPVRQQDKAEGHSVRAMYLYTAMADLAGETGEEDLLNACDRLFDNTVNQRMYITGGIGSTVTGEAFTIDYDLPNDSIYAETCASIGLIFFARKMLDINPSNKYADIMEQTLYNGVLSGMQLDGKKFFYVNPLEVIPEVSGKLDGYKHVLPERPSWYACACCPPNVARLITSLGQYSWGEGNETIYSHLYMGGSAEFETAGGVTIDVESEYPWKGQVQYTIHTKQDETDFTFAIRIPSWSNTVFVTVNGEKQSIDKLMNNGYAYLKRNWKNGDIVNLAFAIPVRRIYANTAVRADAGCVAIMRGSIVYCFEEVDNGGKLHALRIPRNNGIDEEMVTNELGNIVQLKMSGIRMESGPDLYNDKPPLEKEVNLTATPYYTWGNRGVGGMRVWVLEA